MRVIDLLQADRVRILAACRAELADAQSPETVASTVQQFFYEMTQAAAECAEPVSLASLELKEASLVGDSAIMALLRSRVGQLARRSRAPVLISGETGLASDIARALYTLRRTRMASGSSWARQAGPPNSKLT